MLYENVVSRCAAKKISICRLEREAGLGNATVRGWVKSTPNIATIQKVANYLGCTVDELLKPDEVMPDGN